MEKLMEQLYTKKETNSYFKDEYYGYNLVPSHPMITKLNKLASAIVNSKECEYYTQDDIAEEVAYIVIQATNKLVNSGQISEDYIIEHLYTQDTLMAKYWNYIKIRLEGHIKNNLKKKAAAEINFSTIEAYGIDKATGIDIIDSFLISNSNIYADIEDTYNPFIKWFLANKEQILTKTQLKFINCGGINSNNNAPAFRKRIAKRVMEAYYNQFTTNAKENKIMNNVQILRELTGNKSMKALGKYIDEDIVFDIIYSDKTTLEDKVAINEYIDGYIEHLPLTTHMKIICLFEEKLQELEDKLEKSTYELKKITN